MRFWSVLIFSLMLSLCDASRASAQEYPEANYRESVPTLEDVVGHNFGDDITSAQDIVAYLKALESADPSRIQLRTYGQTWQGRDLTYAIISSPDNMARLNNIQAKLQSIGAGEATSDTDIDATPAVVWLAHGVHGDEITPPDSALFMAYHLVAAVDDNLVDIILNNTIVIIDPSQNPDGRERFRHGFVSGLGLEPQADRYAVEHDQAWPRGRFNHYLFDLNRDWFALTQPETRAKVKAVKDWHPVVFVDSHEMGGDQSYFFPPSADPFNPFITSLQREKQDQLGRTMARNFDAYGEPYFTREIFDAFYPGYGDMWPTLNGAVAMTFEQSSPRGLIFDRRDGSQLTYSEGVRNNVLAALGTLETVATDKNNFLRDYANYRRSAIQDFARQRDRYIVLDLSQARYEAEAMAKRLTAQGIAVQRSPAGRVHCGFRYTKGALIIDTAQPQGRLIRTLLGESTELPEAFVKEQESRRARGLYHELYDVTAWSLPIMDGVNAQQCNQVDKRELTDISDSDTIPSITSEGGAYGYIIPWTDGGQAQLVIAALRDGLTGRTTNEAFTKDGRVYPMGSVIFPSANNPSSLGNDLRRLATKIGAEIVSIEDSWVESGPNLGSQSFAALKLPRIALAWGEGTSATSAGNTRYVIERTLGLPVAPIKASTLARADLSIYDVLILPDGSSQLEDEIGRSEPIKRFVRDGGVLVAFSSSVAMLANDNYGLLSTVRENAASSNEDGSGGSDRSKVGSSFASGLILDSQDEYDSHIKDADARPDSVPGVLVKAEANQDHFLSAGYKDANVLVTGSDIYRPLNSADGVNVFRFARAEELLLSGYLWDENERQLAYKPFVMAQESGAGMVIGFTQSPTTRAYLNGLNLLLANTLLLAPARVDQ